MRRATILLSVVLLAASAAQGARAADPASGPAVDKAASDRADELMRKGNALGNKDQWAEAEPLFREAWSLKQSYDIGGNLGIAEATLGKARDAAEHLSFALRTFPVNGKAAHRKLLEDTLAKMRAQVAAVTVRVNVAGAEVTVDGKKVGLSPVAEVVFVEPGSRTIEATREGYTAARQVVTAAKGAESTVELALAASVTPPPTGSSGASVPPPSIPAPSWKIAPPWLIAGGVLAAGGLAAGIGFTAATNGKATDTEVLGARVGSPSACVGQPPAMIAGTCASLHTAAVDHDTFAKAAAVSFALGGALALGTGGLALWAAPKPANTKITHAARVVPVLGREAAGVGVVGTW